MKLTTLYRPLLLGLLLLAGSCSTQKNTPVSRAYHNLTAHYNVYFNAKTSLESGLNRIDEAVEDEYTRILPIFKEGREGSASAGKSDMDYTVRKCAKLVTQHSITQKPKRKKNAGEKSKAFRAKTEFNKWVDDSYLLAGRAHLYMDDYHRASENFSYVIRNFSKEPTRYDAYLWLSRVYTESEQFTAAQEIFDLLAGDPAMPKRLRREFELNQANFFVKQGQLQNAVPHLELALTYRFPRKEKLRYTYILAQLQAELNQPEKAINYYQEVLRMRPAYEMAFNARLNSAEQFTGEGDAAELKKQLRKMLRDDKNSEFQDRIYYAMGKVAAKEGRKADAIDFFRQSAAKSTNNKDQRALSCLTLGRIYFENDAFVMAQNYYDSAMVDLRNDYPGYDEISARAGSLGRLAANLVTIEREDSLQHLARMSEKERNALFDQWINVIREKETARLQAQRDEQLNQSYYQLNQNNMITSGNDGSWYFYNPTTVGIGKSEFQRLWGKRKLEDNWRRKNKLSLDIEEVETLAEIPDDLAQSAIQVRIDDPKLRAYYTQDLPLTDSLMLKSDHAIRDALYAAARIYRSEFDDYERSAELLEELDRRYPGNVYELPAWFDLYQTYKELDNRTGASTYEQKIISTYPGSKYAQFLINPNYFAQLEANRDSMNRLYREAYRNFKQANFAQAATHATQLIRLKPDSLLKPKARFLQLVSQGVNQEPKVFSKLIDHYVAEFPDKEPSILARKIQDLLRNNALADYQKLLTSGYINDSIVNDELLAQRPGADAFDGKFSYKEEMFHYFVLTFARDANVDVNRLIYDIANYNIDYYTTIDFDIERVNLNPRSQMVVVRSLANKKEAMIYFRSIIRKRFVFESLAGREYVNFVTSSSNYRTLLADKDYREYLQFFMTNYSRFISSDFPTDKLPDPEELLKTARTEEIPEQKGEYVVVKTEPMADQPEMAAKEKAQPEYLGPYRQKAGDQHAFILVLPAEDFNHDELIASFNAYNQTTFGSPQMKVKLEKLDDFRVMMIVSGLSNKNTAQDYFRKVIRERTLFTKVEQVNYRNFVIAQENIAILKKEKNLKDYMDFFTKFYLNN